MVLRFLPGDEITIVSGFNASAARIREIVFLDGTVWDEGDVLLQLERQRLSDRDETLNGSDGDDVLAGGRGDDLLIGDRGADRYVFARGDGVDVIREGSFVNNPDVLEIRGYTAAELIFSVSPASALDLEIAFVGTTDRIVIAQQLGNSVSSYVETILLTDDGGVTIGRDQIVADLIAAQQSAGDDTIIGTNGADLIEPGPGDDLVRGGGGNDIYIFRKGDGDDLLIDTGGTNTLRVFGYFPENTTVSQDPLFPASAILTFTDPVSSLTETVRLSQGSSFEHRFDRIEFESGEVWNRTEIDSRMAASIPRTEGNDVILYADGNATIEAGGGFDVIDGDFGDATIIYRRGDGIDTILNRFYFDKVLELPDLDPGDVELWDAPFGSGNRLILTIPGERGQIHLTEGADGIEEIRFAGGTVWSRTDMAANAVPKLALDSGPVTSSGSSGNDTFENSPADDYRSDFRGSDTYVYRLGDGHDVISDSTSFSNVGIDTNTLEFPDIAFADVIARRDPLDRDTLILTFATGPGSVRVQSIFNDSGQFGIQTFSFTDGIRTAAELAALTAPGSGPGADRIVGTDGDDDLDGLGGDDRIEAQAGNDTLTGGTGDDTLFGGEGEDLYLYAPGDGDDRIGRDFGANTLRLTGIASTDVSVDWDPVTGEAVLGFAGGGSVRIAAGSGAFAYDPAGISIDFGRVELADTTWDDATLVGLLPAGFSQVDDPASGPWSPGNGPLSSAFYGGEGTTEFTYARGDGRDAFFDQGFEDEAEVDRLSLTDLLPGDILSVEEVGYYTYLVTYGESAPGAGDGGDFAVSMRPESFDGEGGFVDPSGIEEIVFQDGTSWDRDALLANAQSGSTIDGTAADELFEGTDGPDRLEPGPGNDGARGNGGTDTYVYRRGDGFDAWQDQS